MHKAIAADSTVRPSVMSYISENLRAFADTATISIAVRKMIVPHRSSFPNHGRARKSQTKWASRQPAAIESIRLGVMKS